MEMARTFVGDATFMLSAAPRASIGCNELSKIRVQAFASCDDKDGSWQRPSKLCLSISGHIRAWDKSKVPS